MHVEKLKLLLNIVNENCGLLVLILIPLKY